MAYKHILIAVDLSPESKVLVEKAVSMARPLQRENLPHPR
ncbi:universal stress protein [Salmonella enterica subsp. enterica serovar Adjame]|nr:universal stress protein [Salmonella enterica subsp. enterica serovar Adjame]